MSEISYMSNMRMESQVGGEGAFGSVVQARDITNRRAVAIKQVHSNQASKEEMDLMLKIHLHENIVEIPRDGSCR